MAWCIHLGYSKVILEVDSELLYKQVTNQAKPPWNITRTLSRMQDYISQLQEFRCKNTYREANHVVDVMAKFSHILTAPYVIFDSQLLPKDAKAYYLLEKVEKMTFR